MTILEAIERMQSAAGAAKERLAKFGFSTSVETDYMNNAFKTVTEQKKAKYITVSVVIGGGQVEAGDEYCISIGAEVRFSRVNENQLEQDIILFNKSVDDAIELIDSYEDKGEGLAALVAKANEECIELMQRLKEEEKRNKRVTTVSNIVFWIGILVLFVVALLRQ